MSVFLYPFTISAKSSDLQVKKNEIVVNWGLQALSSILEPFFTT
jgi:hypothetical protein